MDEILTILLYIITNIYIYAFLTLFNQIWNHVNVHPVPAKQLLFSLMAPSKSMTDLIFLVD